MQLTITGYSTALFATWYFIEEYGLLFDAGDGITAALLQKSRKINHVFLSHADRDHVTGLLQLNQLNVREGLPVMHYPKDSGSFRALEAFSKNFDRHVAGTVWKPVDNMEKIFVRDDLYIEAIRNGHVQAPEDSIKSLSYKLTATKRKLKPAFRDLHGEEIRKLREELGEDNVTEEVHTCLLAYSGDTPVEDLSRWNNCKVLIHEATFLEEEADSLAHPRSSKHSKLEEVISMVSNLNIEKLVLGHFSSRYSAQQIDNAIRSLCAKYSIHIPVFRVLPGETVHHILGGQAING